MSKALKNDKLIWLGVDLDKTVADNTGYPNFKLTKPMKGAVEALRKLKRDGWKITIFTARGYGDHQLIEDWLNKYKVPFRRIICGKPLVHWMVDDRNIEFNGDWEEVIKKINK